MNAALPRVYSLAGGEPVLRFGSSNGSQVVVLQPLFEEMNRCRRFVVSLCRQIATQDVDCWLMDLPGTGESPRALETVGWEAWREAVTELAALIDAETGRSPVGVALRGGALLDGALGRRWRFSPVPGASLLADLRRSALAAGGAPEDAAGYRLGDPLRAALEAAEPAGDARTIRLAADERRADRHVEGQPLWRRSEPAHDPTLCATLAEDILAWIG